MIARRPSRRSALLALVLPSLLALATVAAPGMTAATPGAATPPATAGPGSLTAMLRRLPVLPLGGEANAMVSYADIAGQLTAVGLPLPAGPNDPALRSWVQATAGLMAPHNSARMTSPEWRTTFGFDTFQLDQAVEYAAPPRYVTLLRGRFDPAELRAAWTRSGYQPVPVDGGTIYRIADDEQVSLRSTVGRLALASMNDAAILADGTLVFASKLDDARQTLAIGTGRAPAFADQVDIAPLLRAVRPDLVSALLVAGDAVAGLDPAQALLTGTPDVTAIATQAAERSRMPPVVTILLGLTAGGPLRPLAADRAATPVAPAPGQPTARLVVALVMPTAGAAQSAVPIVTRRLATETDRTGRPFATLFPARGVRVAGDGPVVLIDLSLGEGTPRAILVDLLFNRDLRFVAW